MSGQLVQSVKNGLIRDKGLTFSDEWFEACVDWIKENQPASRLTPKSLQEEIFSQWVDANLLEMGCKCLPGRLADETCVALPGRYSLQVLYVTDIGTSAYSQWNKLQKLENENTNVDADSGEQKAAWEPKSRRCIRLTMTDGTQEVDGIELAFVPQLSLDMKPGVKVQVIGPVECRRGVLHLKAQNVKVLGGEVEGLMESNSMGAILQKRMNARQEDRPRLTRPTYKRPPLPPTANIRPPKSQRKIINPTQSSSDASFNSRPTQVLSHSFHPPPASTSSSSFRSRYGKQNATTHVEEDPFGDDDDFFMEIDESILTGGNIGDNTTQVISQGSTGSSQPQRVPALVPSSSSTQQEVIDIPDDDDDDDDFIFSQIPLAPASLSSPPPAKKPKKLCSKSPYQFIKFVKDNMSSFKPGQFLYVKACVATLLSNVSLQEGQWALKVSLNDGSGPLVACVAPELLNKMIGYTALEIKQLKLSSKPADKVKVRNAMSGLSLTLLHMNGLFGIRINQPHPVVTTFVDVQNSHVQALQRRLAAI